MSKRSPSPLTSSAIANNKQRFKELADKIKKFQRQNNKDNISEIKRILANQSNSGFQKDRFQQRDFECLRDIATILQTGLKQVTIKNTQLQASYQYLRNQNDRKQRELFEKSKNCQQLSTQLSRMKSRLYDYRSKQIQSLQLEPMINQGNSYSTQDDSKKQSKYIIIQIQNSTQIVKNDKKSSNNFDQPKLIKLEISQNINNEYNQSDDMIRMGKIKQLQSKIENHQQSYVQEEGEFPEEYFGKCQQIHIIQEKNKLDSPFEQTKICSSAKPTQYQGINNMIEMGNKQIIQSKAKYNKQSQFQVEIEFPEKNFGKCYQVQNDMQKLNKFDSTFEAAKRCHSAKPKYQFQKIQILENGKEAIYGKTKDSLLIQRKRLKKKEEEVPQLLIVYKNTPIQNKAESKDLIVLDNKSPLTSNVQHQAQPNRRRSLVNQLDPQLYDISKNNKLVSNLPRNNNRIFNANNKNNNKTLNPISKEPHHKIN